MSPVKTAYWVLAPSDGTQGLAWWTHIICPSKFGVHGYPISIPRTQQFLFYKSLVRIVQRWTKIRRKASNELGLYLFTPLLSAWLPNLRKNNTDDILCPCSLDSQLFDMEPSLETPVADFSLCILDEYIDISFYALLLTTVTTSSNHATHQTILAFIFLSCPLLSPTYTTQYH